MRELTSFSQSLFFITLSEPLRTSQADPKCFHLSLAQNTYLLPSSRLAPLLVCSLKSSAGPLSSRQKLDSLSLQAPKTLRDPFVAPLHLAWIEKKKQLSHSSTGTAVKHLPPLFCALPIWQNTPLIVSSPGLNFSLHRYRGKDKESVIYINTVSFMGRYLALATINLESQLQF